MPPVVTVHLALHPRNQLLLVDVGFRDNNAGIANANAIPSITVNWVFPIAQTLRGEVKHVLSFVTPFQ